MHYKFNKYSWYFPLITNALNQYLSSFSKNLNLPKLYLYVHISQVTFESVAVVYAQPVWHGSGGGGGEGAS